MGLDSLGEVVVEDADELGAERGVGTRGFVCFATERQILEYRCGATGLAPFLRGKEHNVVHES